MDQHKRRFRFEDVNLVPASEEHLDDFIPRCRPEDRAEALAGTGYPLRYSLKEGIRYSTPYCWTAMAGGHPQVVVGAGPHPTEEDTGVIWMVGTDAIEKHPKLFHVHARLVISLLHFRYRRLTNVADARNVTHIMWLKRLGFTFTKLHPEWGAFGYPFWEFERTVNDVSTRSSRP